MTNLRDPARAPSRVPAVTTEPKSREHSGAPNTKSIGSTSPVILQAKPLDRRCFKCPHREETIWPNARQNTFGACVMAIVFLFLPSMYGLTLWSYMSGGGIESRVPWFFIFWLKLIEYTFFFSACYSISLGVQELVLRFSHGHWSLFIAGPEEKGTEDTAQSRDTTMTNSTRPRAPKETADASNAKIQKAGFKEKYKVENGWLFGCHKTPSDDLEKQAIVGDDSDKISFEAEKLEFVPLPAFPAQTHISGATRCDSAAGAVRPEH